MRDENCEKCKSLTSGACLKHDEEILSPYTPDNIRDDDE